MDLNELTTEVELDENLVPYLYKEDFGKGKWDVLKHPYVYGVPYIKNLNNLYNQQYTAKTDALKKAKESKNWGQYIFFYERPYRFFAFSCIQHHLKDEEYWHHLGNIWTDSENLWQVKNLKSLLTSKRGHRNELMSKEDLEQLNQLPDEFNVYRGHTKYNRSGYSWTMSYHLAQWFATRFDKDGKVTKGICKKSDVIAVLIGRSEFEIIVDPKLVTEKSIVKKLTRSKFLSEALSLAKSEFKLPKSIHGPNHWDAVERNVIELCKRVKDADLELCKLFAILHDCKRENDSYDPEHGVRSANLIKLYYKNLSEERLKKIVYACEQHNNGLISDDPTIGVCWDADRLDLCRVGITPDATMLSTDAAKQMIWKT